MAKDEQQHPERRALEAHERRRVAVEAEVDERTVERYLGGKPIRALSRVRIERTLRTLRAADDNE